MKKRKLTQIKELMQLTGVQIVSGKFGRRSAYAGVCEKYSLNKNLGKPIEKIPVYFRARDLLISDLKDLHSRIHGKSYSTI